MTSKDLVALTGETGTEQKRAGEQNTDVPASVGRNDADAPRTITVQHTILANRNRVLREGPTGAKNSFDVGSFSLLQSGAETDLVSAAACFEGDGPPADPTRRAGAKLAPDESAGERNDKHEVASFEFDNIGLACIAGAGLFANQADPLGPRTCFGRSGQ